MARVLVSESDSGVRGLLLAVLRRRGHDAVVLPARADEELPEGDLLVAEPAYGHGLLHAWALRDQDPSLAIVLVSILPPERAFLGLRPAAYLLKPFSVAVLERAVEAALTSSAAAAR